MLRPDPLRQVAVRDPARGVADPLDAGGQAPGDQITRSGSERQHRREKNQKKPGVGRKAFVHITQRAPGLDDRTVEKRQRHDPEAAAVLGHGRQAGAGRVAAALPQPVAFERRAVRPPEAEIDVVRPERLELVFELLAQERQVLFRIQKPAVRPAVRLKAEFVQFAPAAAEQRMERLVTDLAAVGDQRPDSREAGPECGQFHPGNLRQRNLLPVPRRVLAGQVRCSQIAHGRLEQPVGAPEHIVRDIPRHQEKKQHRRRRKQHKIPERGLEAELREEGEAATPGHNRTP